MTVVTAGPPAVPPPSGPPVRPSLRRCLTSPAARLAIALGLVTALVRLPRLGTPGAFVFDEIYYANDALDLIEHGVAQDRVVHPQLGKWMIAAGIEVWGFNPVGWRLAPWIAGAVVVSLVVVVAHRLTRSLGLAAVTGLLVLVDGISFTTGRLAMLDGLVAVFTTLTVFGLLMAVRHPLDLRAQRRRKLAIGAVIGLGAAVKWTALALLPVAVVTLLALDATVAPRGRLRRRELAVTGLAMLAVPALVYLGAHTTWLVRYPDTHHAAQHCEPECSSSPIERVGAFVDDQLDVLRFHRRLDPTNRFAAPSWRWWLLQDPVGLFVKECDPSAPARVPGDGVCPTGATSPTEARVLAAPNPAVWAAGMGATLALAVLAIRRRDAIALVLLGSATALWLPWMLGREGFSFYAAPLVPVLALGAGYTLYRSRHRRWLGPAVALAAVGCFVWLYPILSATPISSGHADLLLPFPSWR